MTIIIRYGVIVLLAFLVIGLGYLLSYHKPTKYVSTAVVATGTPASTKVATNETITVPIPMITRADILNAYNADHDAVIAKADVLFKGPQTSSPKLVVKTSDAAVAAHIDQLRLYMTKTLNSWQNLVKDLPPVVTDQNSIELANDYASTTNAYIDQLQKIVDNLTPKNSGLTPAQIAADQAAIDTAKVEADRAVAALGSTSPNDQSNNPIPTTNPSVDPGAGNTSSSSSNDSTTSSSGDQQSSGNNPDNQSPQDTSSTTGDLESPPSPPSGNSSDNSGPPHLIEGANPIN